MRKWKIKQMVSTNINNNNNGYSRKYIKKLENNYKKYLETFNVVRAQCSLTTIFPAVCFCFGTKMDRYQSFKWLVAQLPHLPFYHLVIAYNIR